jgi:methionyl-tRNA formyltransferase
MGLRIAFFGTPDFAVPVLQALAESSHPVVLVVTQPDRRRGRGQRVEPGPVKMCASTHGIPVLQPDRMRDEAFLGAFRAEGVDLGVVAAYGRILPQALLEMPRLGMVNVHASLLPRWRGAAPVHRAILSGDTHTGVTIMRVVAALDAGPMLDARTIAIGPDETSAVLERRLAVLGAALCVDVVRRLERGTVEATPQDESRVTYAARLERRESRVDWSRPAVDIHNQIRGLQPWPMAAVLWKGKRLTLRRSRLAGASPLHRTPGVVSEVGPDGIVVGTGTEGLALTEIQLEGRPIVPLAEFLNGHHLSAGDRLDPLIVD